MSSTVAARSLRTEPKCFSSVARRAGPRPGTSSSALAVAAFQLAYYYPQLPAVIAGHFNAAGEPNSWEPKGVFVAIICFVYVIFAALAWALPQ